MKKTLFLCLLLSAGILNTAKAEGGPSYAPAGTEITNTANLDYTKDDGNDDTITSNTVTATVQAVNSFTITPNTTSTGECGQTVTAAASGYGVLTYTLTNTGNERGSFTLTVPDGAQIYRDRNGNSTYDPGIDTLWSNGAAMFPEDSRTFFVVRQMPDPADEKGGTVTQFNPQGVSNNDPNVTETDNLGCIVTQNLSQAEIFNETNILGNSPSTRYANHSVYNEGNTTLNSSNTVLTATLPAGYKTEYAIGFRELNNEDTRTYYSTLQEAFAAAGDLEPDKFFNFTEKVLIPSGQTVGSQTTIPLQVYITTPSDAQNVNNTSASNPSIVTDTVTITQGKPNIIKTQSLCTVTDNTLNCDEPTTDIIRPLPCQTIRYDISMTNQGDGPIMSAKVRDTVPDNTELLLVEPKSVAYSQSYVRINGNLWQTPDQISYPLPAGTVVEIAYDINGDGQVPDNYPAGRYANTSQPYLLKKTNTATKVTNNPKVLVARDNGYINADYGMVLYVRPLGKNCPAVPLPTDTTQPVITPGNPY